MPPLKEVHSRIIDCKSCPRLRKHCVEVAKTRRKAFANETYWGKPITGFGDPQARMIIVGLAPAAHGANRTGRIFTGDRSGLWLYRALHKAKFANQSTYESAEDGLQLTDIYITCVVKCAPPDNKPRPEETSRCIPHLKDELKTFNNIKLFLILGQIALNALWPVLAAQFPSVKLKKPSLKHGGELSLPNGQIVLLSYHPSQQNTFTGRLTEPMFDSVFSRARDVLNSLL